MSLNTFCWLSFILALIFIAYLIFQNRVNAKRRKERQALIDSKVQSGEWTPEMAEAVLNRKLAIDMEEEMVLISWGKPNAVDKIEILKSGSEKKRWIYGVKGRGADYISFKDGKVINIKMRN